MIPGRSEDYHVHSTWSDDAHNPLEANLEVATRRGLRTICMVEHVRTTSSWIPEFVAAANALRPRQGLDIRIGVEAKLLDTTGRLDMPEDLSGLDHVLIADHQWPGEHGPMTPTQVRGLLGSGTSPGELIDWLVTSTGAAVSAQDRPVVAHLWSILPKVGLSEEEIPDAALEDLAHRCAAAGALVEINEKWSCPGVRTLRCLVAAGVDIVLSTDAHHCNEVGVYRSETRELLLEALATPGPSAARTADLTCPG